MGRLRQHGAEDEEGCKQVGPGKEVVLSKGHGNEGCDGNRPGEDGSGHRPKISGNETEGRSGGGKTQHYGNCCKNELNLTGVQTHSIFKVEGKEWGNHSRSKRDCAINGEEGMRCIGTSVSKIILPVNFLTSAPYISTGTITSISISISMGIKISISISISIIVHIRGHRRTSIHISTRVYICISIYENISIIFSICIRITIGIHTRGHKCK
mmetsp:Transcript_17452/g.39399  ORF Transcript_17452/g.39399 Transcript_17452/m.39399 type:complete len:212 (-) Transcript_17452:299-934(-)